MTFKGFSVKSLKYHVITMEYKVRTSGIKKRKDIILEHHKHGGSNKPSKTDRLA